MPQNKVGVKAGFQVGGNTPNTNSPNKVTQISGNVPVSKPALKHKPGGNYWPGQETGGKAVQ